MKWIKTTHNKTNRSSILCGMLLLSLLCGCNFSEQKTQKNNSIEVTDFRGKTIKLNKPAERIVCLSESALSGLYMLDAGTLIQGVSTNIFDSSVFPFYSSFDKRIENKSMPAPGNWDFINIESVIALRPDIVIVWASQTESIEALENAGIQVYAVMLHSFNDVYKEIADFGLLTGKTERADSLISFTKSEVKTLQLLHNKIEHKKSVYFMWAQGMLETSGKASTVNELIEMAGAYNACTLNDEHVVVNIEKVIEWNPEVILMWNNDRLDSNDIRSNIAWENISAVRNHNIFELPSVFYCDLWTLKFPYAIKFLMHEAYPELREDIDLDQEWKNMYNYLYNNIQLKE